MNSLSIRNYKNLEDIQIDNLGIVNLIAGENNVGKSSLLEGISILQAGGRIDWLKQLLKFRGEGIDSSIYNNEERIQKEMERFLSFIPNFDENNMFNLTIEFSCSNSSKTETSLHKRIILRFVHFTELKISENGIDRTIRTIIETVNPNDVYDNLGVGLEITNGNQKTIYPFYGVRSRFLPETSIIMQYVRMGDTNNEDNSSLFDRLALTPLQKYVVSALQIIEPRITDINFLKDDKRRSSANDDARIPYVILEGETKRRRLGSMGDGINRILTIILAMLNCKDGTLLIDEFENGLHYSVQRKLWRIIFKLAKELNIQVFATTHSNDTIRSFADENSMGEGVFLRLEHHKGKIQAVTFSDNKDLTFVLDQNIEIR